MHVLSFLLAVALASASNLLGVCGSGTDEACGTAFLVESIPYSTSVEITEGARNTWEVLTAYTNAAKERIDFTAMYWDLLAQNKEGQVRNFTAEEFLALGSDRGTALYEALLAAARRGVKLRVLNGKGISSAAAEIFDIAAKYPEAVEVRTWDAEDWYGGGIMHQKFWIFDDAKVYLGSANMDWLSLTQVKEMGVALEGASGFSAVQDLRKLFDRWWLWTAPDGPQKKPSSVWDPLLQVTRPMPCWEATAALRNRDDMCANPFPTSATTAYNHGNQMPLVLNGSAAGSYFSCSPPSVCDAPVAVNSMFAESPGGRQWDGDAVIRTILSAQESISLSVMDYVPSSIYQLPLGNNPVEWPELNTAIMAKVRQGTRVRMLISHWAHSRHQQWAYLRALQAAASSCQPGCKGALEIRAYELPGWTKTFGAEAEYPPYTRVNHAKYIVTDQRFNIGTSNMVWSYFHNTAGSSFNSDHAALRQQLQAAFDRDWGSDYAVAIPTGDVPSEGSPTVVHNVI